MRFSTLTKTVKNIKRYRAIVQILIKYGFEDIIDRLKIDIVIHEGKRKLLRKKSEEFIPKSRHQRFRMVLEELGPTFIKLGQMLSTRTDILPSETIKELQKLQDSVKPIPVKEIIESIEEELEKPLNELFKEFDRTPQAAASIAQVHGAVTKDGMRVVVKVQRPNIKSTIVKDVAILSDLSQLIVRSIPESEVYDPVGLVEEFKSWIQQELDFYQEARNIDRFRKNFEGDSIVYIPEVYWNLTTDKIVTMEYIDGICINDIDAIEKAGLDRREIAKNGANAVLKQIFEHGFFHGDPHPGNIRVLPGNVIAPIDFGLVGRIDQETIEHLSDLLSGIVKKDSHRVVRVMMNMEMIKDDINLSALRIDLTDMIDRYIDIPLSHINIDQVHDDFLKLVKVHKIRFPRNLYLMGKTFIVMESIGRELDPEFDILSLAKPYITRLILTRYNPARLTRDLIHILEAYSDLIRTLPDNIRQILVKVGKGQLGINLYHQGLNQLIRELDKSTNRLSFSLIIAALIISSSLIIQLNLGPKIFGLSAFGLLGYLTAAFLGFWLVIAILRSGRL